MNVTILFPSDYFSIKKVDPDFEPEYNEVIKLQFFNTAFFNFDNFISNNTFNIYPKKLPEGLCIYRGWMLPSSSYSELYGILKSLGLTLINSPCEYQNCHEFPNSYNILNNLTQRIEIYPEGTLIDWKRVRDNLGSFIMKDYVKSVKEYDFPKVFDPSLTDEQLNNYVMEFKKLRGSLYTKGIVLKQYLNLASENGETNEFRGFYLYGKLLTLSANSNQGNKRKFIPKDFLNRVPRLNSNFYTIDFAELNNGNWLIIETGDGQVSDLPPYQNIYEFYNEIRLRLFNQ